MSNLISRTGRVQSWIDDPTSRLPVSCTTFVVEDSMEGDNGIEASWRFASHALRYGAGCAIHLSKLRPAGHENDKGLVATGPVSFGKIYSALNETLRRGGAYKNGAIVLHLDLCHPDVVDFITASDQNCLGSSVASILTTTCGSLQTKTLRTLYFMESNQETSGSTKSNTPRPGSVSMETSVLRYTCPHVGRACYSMSISVPVHSTIYKRLSLQVCPSCAISMGGQVLENLENTLPPDNDRQVGLGVLGLANFLRRYNITYEKFGEALRLVNLGHSASNEAGCAAWALNNAIFEAAQIARENNMVRAFAIAPTASCSYRSRDLDGFTCTPEIAPPIAKKVDRDSGEFGERVNYGDVEIASEVGWDAYKRVADEIMKMLDRTGLLHGYSFNSWSDMIRYDEAFIEEWLGSPQTSLYYSLQVMGDVQDKSDAYAALGDTDIQDYLDGILDNKIECDCQQ